MYTLDHSHTQSLEVLKIINLLINLISRAMIDLDFASDRCLGLQIQHPVTGK